MILSVASKLPLLAPVLASRTAGLTKFFSSTRKGDKTEEISYTYQSPGSSIRDPLNINTTEPVHLFDPPAKPKTGGKYTKPVITSKAANDDGTYTYLPPGSSLGDPVQVSTSDPVHFYDPPTSGAPKSKSKSKASGRETLTSKYSYSKKKTPKEVLSEDDTYTYQSPGSSIRDPVQISMSEPVVFYDPPTKEGGVENVPGRVQDSGEALKPKEPRKYTSAKKKQEKKVETEDATYMYQSPGSSIRDPVQISTSEPVHFYDPVSDTKPKK